MAHPAEARRIKTGNGDTLEISYKPALRLIWAGASTNRLIYGDSYLTLFPEMLKLIAETAQEHSADRFAITGAFCIKTNDMYIGIRAQCKLQAVPLRPGEMVVPRPKDDQPVYFVTLDALSGKADRSWMRSLNLGSGIRERAEIARAGSAGAQIP
ncbi:hypothetical protein U1769_00200 [Sphingomonas sp. ZT3P38]|uniref:hypothetical protein n=1 Tax=Parasphingomonas zepuensis TaxID=3096161 RepID=UPI002FC61D8C